MRSARTHLLRALLFATAPGGALAAEATLPEAGARFSGSFIWGQQPAISWELNAQSSMAANEARAAFTLSSDGLKAQGDAVFEPRAGLVGWKVDRATVDLAVWARPLATQASPSAPIGDFLPKGVLTISSQGQLKDGKPSGSATLTMEGASLSSREYSLKIDGISFGLQVDDLSRPRSPPAQLLSFASAEFAEIKALAGNLRFQIFSQNEFRLEHGEMKMLGGTIAVDPFTVALVNGTVNAFEAKVRVSGLAMGEVALLLPQALAEAKGRISGEITLHWSPSEGLHLGDGRFSIDRSGAVELRLTPHPGFLTEQIPVKITLLPAWLGKLSRWLAADNPAYQVLRAVEMGDLALTVDTLEVQAMPDGDSRGRTAHVLMTARPKTGELIEKVVIEVNVSGPLDQVIKFSLANRISIQSSP